MRAAEKAKQTMCLDLVALATKFPEKTQKIPIFERLIQNIATTIAPIAVIESQAQQSTKGITLEKNTTQAELKMTVGRLCNVMVAHAFADKNVALESDLKILRAKFNTTALNDFAAVCTTVVAETRKLSAHWLDIGITEMDLQGVETKITLFTQQVPKGKSLKTDKKKAVKKRTTIFESIYTKKQITDVAAAYMGADDEFYDDIVSILGVKKRTLSASQITVVFKSAATQAPMMHQSARIVGTDVTLESDKKGEITFKFAKGGLYTIEVPLPNGEFKMIKDVEVKNRRTTRLEIFI